jgi:CubicO group peptidase (beta-lactamase class C family)
MSFTAFCIAGEFAKDLNGYIESGMSTWKIPGLSIAIASDDQIVYEVGFGVLDVGKPEKVNVGALFAVGTRAWK